MGDTVDDRDLPPTAPHPNQRRSACERCRRQKLKCSRQNAANQSSCQRCAQLGIGCVGGRQRKIGRPSRSNVAAVAAAAAASSSSSSPPTDSSTNVAATAPPTTNAISSAARSPEKGSPSLSSTRVRQNPSTHSLDSGFGRTDTSNAPSSRNSTPEPCTVKLTALLAHSVKVSQSREMNDPARSSGVPLSVAEQQQPSIGSDYFSTTLGNIDNLFHSFYEQDNRFPKTSAPQLPGNVALLLDMSYADNQQSTTDISNNFHLTAETPALHESVDIAWPLGASEYQDAQALKQQQQQRQRQQTQQQSDKGHQTHQTYYQHQYTQQRNQSPSKAQPWDRSPNSRPHSSFIPFPTPYCRYLSFNARDSRDHPLEPLVAGPTTVIPGSKSTSPKTNSSLYFLDKLSAINTNFQQCLYPVKKHREALKADTLIENKPPLAINGVSAMDRGLFNLKELLRLLVNLQDSMSSITEDSQSGDPQPQPARMKLPVSQPHCIDVPLPSPALDDTQHGAQEASSSSSETATNTPELLDTPTSLAIISCYSQALFFLETIAVHINQALANPDTRLLYDMANRRCGDAPFHEHLTRGLVFAQILTSYIERLNDLVGVPLKDPSVFPVNSSSSRGLLNERQTKMLWLELLSKRSDWSSRPYKLHQDLTHMKRGFALMLYNNLT